MKNSQTKLLRDKITISLLKDTPESINRIVEIWQECLGHHWDADYAQEVQQILRESLNESFLPLAFVAFSNNKPVGMCHLKKSDGLRPILSPWLRSLVVTAEYQNQGIGKLLIEAVKQKAKALGFQKLYLWTYEGPLPDEYYKPLGWKKVGTGQYLDKPLILMMIKL